MIATKTLKFISIKVREMLQIKQLDAKDTYVKTLKFYPYFWNMSTYGKIIAFQFLILLIYIHLRT